MNVNLAGTAAVPALPPAWRESLALRVLECLGPGPPGDDPVRAILRAVLEETGLQSVGVRLRQGSDFPFEEFVGQPPDSWREDSGLLVRGPGGEPQRDAEGRPLLACRCGAVLSGAALPGRLTPGGSFLTGQLQLVARDELPPGPGALRECCVAAGFETLALVPLREAGETVGLLHLADRRPGLLGPDEVAFLERLSASLVAALARRRAEATERALSASEERWRAVVQNEPECVKLLDAEGRVLDMNPAGLAMIQAELRQVAGGRASSLVAPEDRTAFDEMVEAVFHGESRRLVFDMIGLRGRRLTLETTSVPLWDSPARQRVTTLLGVTRDITARRQAEQALRAAAEDWVSTFDALESGVLLLDGQDRVTRANRAAVALAAGWPGGLTGRPLAELAPGQPWDAVREVVEAVRRLGAGQLRQVREPLGRAWDVDGTPAPARDGGTRVVVTVRDVSRLVELQESVKRGENMAAMGELVAGVAHEVRNPLFAILANLDALGAVLGDERDVADLLSAMRQEVERLRRLMKDLLDYGRPSAPQFEREGLRASLEAALAECRETARAAGVVVELPEDAESAPVWLDRARLAQVFENLLRNAIQHSPAGGRVSVRWEGFEEDGRAWLRCCVCDHGPGFDAQALAHLFDPFFTRRRGGTGLGLSIAQRIVEQHHGRIRVRNRAGSGGGCVTVELPQAPAG